MESTRYSVINIVHVTSDRARLLRATFDLEVAGLGTIRACRYLVKQSERYVLGPSLKDAYRGWFQVVHFERTAAAEILDVYEQALREERNAMVAESMDER